MNHIQDTRSFLIQWNNTFPLDRDYRKKYNIAFNSNEHREVNQVDVYLEWMENEIFTEHESDVLIKIKKEELLKKGEWISEREEEVPDDLFDKIVI